MDYIFEQKLVRENRQLQIELSKLNNQIKQLQEKIVGYEQVISQLDEGKEAELRRLGAKRTETEYRLTRIEGGKSVPVTTAGKTTMTAGGSDSSQKIAQLRTKKSLQRATGRINKLEIARQMSLGRRAVERTATILGNGPKDPSKQQIDAAKLSLNRIDAARQANAQIGTFPAGVPIRSSKDVMARHGLLDTTKHGSEQLQQANAERGQFTDAASRRMARVPNFTIPTSYNWRNDTKVR